MRSRKVSFSLQQVKVLDISQFPIVLKQRNFKKKNQLIKLNETLYFVKNCPPIKRIDTFLTYKSCAHLCKHGTLNRNLIREGSKRRKKNRQTAASWKKAGPSLSLSSHSSFKREDLFLLAIFTTQGLISSRLDIEQYSILEFTYTQCCYSKKKSCL